MAAGRSKHKAPRASPSKLQSQRSQTTTRCDQASKTYTTKRPSTTPLKDSPNHKRPRMDVHTEMDFAHMGAVLEQTQHQPILYPKILPAYAASQNGVQQKLDEEGAVFGDQQHRQYGPKSSIAENTPDESTTVGLDVAQGSPQKRRDVRKKDDEILDPTIVLRRGQRATTDAEKAQRAKQTKNRNRASAGKSRERQKRLLAIKNRKCDQLEAFRAKYPGRFLDDFPDLGPADERMYQEDRANRSKNPATESVMGETEDEYTIPSSSSTVVSETVRDSSSPKVYSSFTLSKASIFNSSAPPDFAADNKVGASLIYRCSSTIGESEEPVYWQVQPFNNERPPQPTVERAFLPFQRLNISSFPTSNSSATISGVLQDEACEEHRQATVHCSIDQNAPSEKCLVCWIGNPPCSRTCIPRSQGAPLPIDPAAVGRMDMGTNTGTVMQMQHGPSNYHGTRRHGSFGQNSHRMSQQSTIHNNLGPVAYFPVRYSPPPQPQPGCREANTPNGPSAIALDVGKPQTLAHTQVSASTEVSSAATDPSLTKAEIQSSNISFASLFLDPALLAGVSNKWDDYLAE